jgi:hypothetical protein
MIRLKKKAARNLDGIFDQLAVHAISLPSRNELAGYLKSHPELANRLGDICSKVRAWFGSNVELTLELYVDPEVGDRYVALYVRQEMYTTNLMDRIVQVSAELHPILESVTGYLLVTTDFARPRGANGI